MGIIARVVQGFFNISSWITAVAGAVALLGVVHLVEDRRGSGRSSVRQVRRPARLGR
jgi:hypothetical protein